MTLAVGSTVVVLQDLYDDGIERVAVAGEIGTVRSVGPDGLLQVEFEIGRVVTMHPSCVGVKNSAQPSA